MLPGATESEVLKSCQQSHPDHVGVDLLSDITALWITVAWAHRSLTTEQIRQLNLRWQNHFVSRALTVQVAL